MFLNKVIWITGMDCFSFFSSMGFKEYPPNRMTLQFNSQYFIHQIIVHFTPPITGAQFQHSSAQSKQILTINHRLELPPDWWLCHLQSPNYVPRDEMSWDCWGRIKYIFYKCISGHLEPSCLLQPFLTAINTSASSQLLLLIILDKHQRGLYPCLQRRHISIRRSSSLENDFARHKGTKEDIQPPNRPY